MEEIKINEIGGDKIEAIKRQSPAALPDNPSESGMRPNTIKGFFWTPHKETFGLINKIVAAINEAFGKVGGEIDAANGQIDDLKTDSDSMNETMNAMGRAISMCLGGIKTIEYSQENASLKCSPIEGESKTVLLPFSSMITGIRYDDDDAQLKYQVYGQKTESTVDLPFEKLLASGSYDHDTKNIYLFFEDESRLEIPVGDLVDEYAGDGGTVDIYRDTNGARKIKIHDTFMAEHEAVKQKAEEAYHTTLNGNLLYANAVKGEASGLAGRIDDLSPLPHYPQISIKGVSSQVSAPSAEGGAVAVTHSDPTLRLCGRNMFLTTWLKQATKNGITVKVNEDGSINVSGTASADLSSGSMGFSLQEPSNAPVLLRRGSTYRASLLDAEGERITSGYNIRYCGGDVSSYDTLFTSLKDAFEYSDDKSEFNGRIMLYFPAIALGETLNLTLYPMLEIYNGEEDIYEPCSDHRFVLPELMGYGDYRDEIVVDASYGTVKLIKRYYKYEFTGEEAWKNIASSYDGTLGSLNASSSPRAKPSSVASQMCDALPAAYIYYSDIKGIYTASPAGLNHAQIFARIPEGYDFNAVFGAGTSIYYPLETEIETDCSNEDWAKVLLSYITNGETLTFDSGAIVTVKYARDVNKTIQRLTEAIVALGGTI